MRLPQLRTSRLNPDYRSYQDVAERLAIEAGTLLRESYGRVAAREKGPADLVTDADFASQALIAEGLSRAFPDHTLLAEEEGAVLDPEKPWRWVVDPLDGTINFGTGSRSGPSRSRWSTRKTRRRGHP